MRHLRHGGNRWPTWLRRRDVLLLIGLFVLLSVTYNLVTPIGESDNELSHFRYIQYIWLHHTLPPYDYQWPSVPQARCSLVLSQASHQFRQPPLYYTLNALLFFWLDLSDTWWPKANPYGYHALNLDGGRNAFLHTPQERFPYHGVVLAVHLIRGFSTVLGVIFLLITYALARLLLRDEQEALLCTAATVLTPAVLFSASVINNDILVAVLGVGALYFAFRGALTPNPLDIVPALGLFAMAMIAKYTAVLLIPTLALAAGVMVVRALRGHLPSHVLLRALPWVILVLLPVGGWFWWNWIHYGQVVPGYAHLAEVVAYHWRKWKIMPWPDIRHHVWEGVTFSFVSYWGLLGADALTLPPWLLNGLAGIWGGVVLGGIIALRRGRISRRELQIALLIVLGFVIAWAGLFIAIVYAPRGRYILALYPLLTYLLVLGLRGWGLRGHPRWGLYAYALVVLAVAIYAPFRVIRPAFMPPNTRQSTAPQANEWPIHATIDTLAELISVRVSPQNVTDGDEVTVTLRWRVLEETDNNYVVGVHLQGLDRSYLGGTAHWPANGRYATSLWKKGDVFLDTYHFRVHVPEGARLPQGAQVLISVYCQSEEGDRGLPIYDGRGTRIGDFLLTPPIRVGPAMAANTQKGRTPKVMFGDELGVIDIQGVPETLFTAPGHSDIHVRLKALTKPRKDYTMYIQILDKQQMLWLTVDRPLGGGVYPSHLWLPGEEVVHTHPFPAGKGRQLPAGTYYVVMGIYDSTTGKRLPVRGNGEQVYAGGYLLTTWTVPRILHTYVPYIGIASQGAP